MEDSSIMKWHPSSIVYFVDFSRMSYATLGLKSTDKTSLNLREPFIGKSSKGINSSQLS